MALIVWNIDQTDGQISASWTSLRSKKPDTAVQSSIRTIAWYDLRS